MKKNEFIRNAVIIFILTLLFYVAGYNWIEHRRHFKGPWEVVFVTQTNGECSMRITQPALQISQTLKFAGEKSKGPATEVKMRFEQPILELPSEVPFGKVIYQDLTFLPGVVTMHLFSHDIELLPRVLIVDKSEYPWRAGSEVVATNLVPSP